MPIDAQQYRTRTQLNNATFFDKTYKTAKSLTSVSHPHRLRSLSGVIQHLDNINNTSIAPHSSHFLNPKNTNGVIVFALLFSSVGDQVWPRNHFQLDNNGLPTGATTAALIDADLHVGYQRNMPIFNAAVVSDDPRRHIAPHEEKPNALAAHFDLLRFPAAEASPVQPPPLLRDLVHPLHRVPVKLPQVLEFQDRNLNQYLLSMLGGDDGLLPDGLDGLSPMVFFLPKAEQQYRVIRGADLPQNNESIIDYEKNINTNCNIKTKTLDGNVVGYGWLTDASQLPTPAPELNQEFSRLISRSKQQVLMRQLFSAAINQRVDVLLGYCTGDLNPLLRYGLALGFKDMGHNIDGDSACEKHKLTKNQLNNEIISAVSFYGTRHSTNDIPKNIKTRELKNTIPFQPTGLFVQQGTPSGINTEKNLSLDYQGQNYLIKDNAGDNFVAINSATGSETNIYYDDETMKIHFSSDMPAGQGVDANIVNGRKYINIQGQDQELVYDWQKKEYYIVVNKKNGNVRHIPVYMEPLSSTWLMATENHHKVFNQQQSDIISSLAVPMYRDYTYQGKYSIDRFRDGNGKLYDITHQSDVSKNPNYQVVEMKGALLPVRLNTNNEYEVYNKDLPHETGYAIEYDGNRWLFRKPASVPDTENLIKDLPADMYLDAVDTTELSGPDYRGIRWNAQGEGYLKVNNKYIRMLYPKEREYIVFGENMMATLEYRNNEFSVQKLVGIPS